MAKSRKPAFVYDYPRPALTVDVALVSRDEPPKVLLIRRLKEPFAGRWALPGGFVDENEPLAAAARRELREETGLAAEDLEQLHTFGEPGRDPRGWV
ncbi:MAG TPA: NUDIX hydrolase, partial [Gemmataceae bacterium]